MSPDDIKLDSIDRMFQYESQARIIEQLNHDEAINMAKSYLKLYIKQQEVLQSLGLPEDLTD